MAVVLCSVFGAGAQFFTQQGVVLVGGKLNTYVAGSLTPVATYTDSTGAVANANPVVLDSGGRLTQQIWITAGTRIKFVVTDSTGASLGPTIDNIPGVNDVSAGLSVISWSASGVMPSFVNAMQFSAAGDQTSLFAVGSRIRYTVTAGVFYGTVSASVYVPTTTTVTVVADTIVLDSGLSAVAISPITVAGSPVGAGQIIFSPTLPYLTGTIGSKLREAASARDVGGVSGNILSALRLSNGAPGARFELDGYAARGDSGPTDTFWYDSTDVATADDGFFTIVSSGGARWKRIVNRHVLDVRKGGAKCDAVTDDINAVNATLSIAASGAVISMPLGLAAVSATVTINKDVTFEGVSKGRSGFYALGFVQDQSILNYTGTTGARIQSARLKNIALWSNNNLARGMTLTWVNLSSFEDVYFYNLYRGFYGDHCWSNNFKNISIFNITVETATLTAECNNILFDRVQFGGLNGVNVTGNCAGLTFNQCDFETVTGTTGRGILLAPVTGSAVSGVVVSSYFEGIKGAAIACAGVDVGSVRGLTVKGSSFYGGFADKYGSVSGNATNAIILSRVDGFECSNNVFTDWETNAFFRDATEANGQVKNNFLTRCPNLSNAANQFSSTVDVQNNTFGRKVELVTAVPTTGAHSVGDWAIAINSIVGQPKGWKCTVAGTPGTFVSEGVL